MLLNTPTCSGVHSMKQAAALLLLVFLSFSSYNSNARPKSRPLPGLRSGQRGLTKEERTFAIQFLKETESGVFNAVKDLNEAQLTFKPAAGKWSIEECVKHIAAAEETLWKMVEAGLTKPVNPEKRAALLFTDQQLIKAVEDRSKKSKTFAALEPAHSSYKTLAEALAAFKENREKRIRFIQNTKADLRNHVLITPIGTYDAYQFILLISAHSNRHTQQIEEVKASTDFPKQA